MYKTNGTSLDGGGISSYIGENCCLCYTVEKSTILLGFRSEIVLTQNLKVEFTIHQFVIHVNQDL